MAEQRAVELRVAAEQRAAEQRAAEQRAIAEQRAAAQRAAEEEAARQAAAANWQPAPSDGEWIPAGAPGSNWSPSAEENGSEGEYVGRRRAAEPAMSTPPADAHHGRHSAGPEASDPGRPKPPHAPTLAAPPPPPAAPHAAPAPTPPHRPCGRRRTSSPQPR